MRHTKAFTAAVGAALLLGCAFRGPRTEITADDSDLTPLVGTWTGAYSSEETRRTGDIWFTLRAEDRSASGVIEMLAARQANASPVGGAGDRPIIIGPRNYQAKEILSVHFVRKERNRVVGLLDPYIDPDCACSVTTTFQGLMAGDRIEGTYTTRSAELAHIPTAGQWKVRRVKP